MPSSNRRSPLLAALPAALLLALAAPAAFAADGPCLNPDGTPVTPAPGTNQGIEYGPDNTTCDARAVALGQGNTATGWNSLAVGGLNRALYEDAVAVGQRNWASGDASTAMGYYNMATGKFSAAVGFRTAATGTRSAAAGNSSWASGDSSVAFGSWYDRNGDGERNLDTDIGDWEGDDVSSTEYTIASAKYATAIGAGARSTQEGALALGADAAATHAGSAAIGYHSATDRDNSVSFGSAGALRQLTFVAAGTQATDAVNLGQLQAAIGGIASVDLAPVASAFGGGAAYAGGVFTPPSYAIQGIDYHDVGAAFAAINTWMTSNANGVQYDDASKRHVTLQGSGGTQVHNLAAGTAATDAVNKAQLDAGDAATLAAAKAHADAGDARTLQSAKDFATAGDAATLSASKSYTDATAASTLTSAKTYADTRATAAVNTANAYTDGKFAAWNDTFTQYRTAVDARFTATDKRISQIGAMSSAMTHMAANAVPAQAGNGRMAIGVGSQSGKAAVSIGYGKRLGNGTSFTLGASFSGCLLYTSPSPRD